MVLISFALMDVEKGPRPKTPLETIREKQVDLSNQLARLYQNDQIELPQENLTCVMEFLKEANEIGANTTNMGDYMAISLVIDWWTGPLAGMGIKNPYVLHLKDKPQKKPRKFWIF